MNLVDDKQLALRLKQRQVSSREQLFYLLVFILLSTAMTTSFALDTLHYAPTNQWDYCIDVMAITFTIAGTIWCYRANKAGDDKEFIERYVCISLPVLIKAFALLMLGMLVLLWTMEIPEETTVYDLVLSGMSMVYFYWRLRQSITLAATS